MKKYSPKFMALVLASLISSATSGCGKSEIEQIVTPVESASVVDYDINVLTATEVDQMVVTPAPKEEEKPTYEINMVDTIVASEDTSIKDETGELLGTLPAGRSINVDNVTEDGNYEVTYYDNTAYVSSDDVIASTRAEVTGKITKMLYAENDTVLTVPDYLNPDGVELEVQINALECFEVYAEFEDCYLVQTIDYVGYIPKTDLKELTGTFVVVDISNQELRLYVDNELVLKSPVVTGTPNEERHTDEGAWEVFEITYNRALNGPGYSSPVDIMIKFHGGEGLHDAEYHTCDFWKKKGLSRHGWRALSEFGGNTYIVNGSHGCVNMPHDKVFEVAEYVTIGTPVIVKK